MLDEISLKKDDRDEVLDEISKAAEACLDGDGTLDDFKALVKSAERSGFFRSIGPIRAARILKAYPRSAQDMVLDEFSDARADEISLVITASEERDGLIVAKTALKASRVPEFISFVAAFPDDFLTVYVALRDDCEKTLELLMDKAREIGFEFTYSAGRWECHRYNEREQKFDLVVRIPETTYVHSGIQTLVLARFFELDSALKDLTFCEQEGIGNEPE